ncbi:hypothetical protein sos41_13750 [Alphaproteobacteria bacterium SO-S41]|nr:hypothetical protein sos41_13750 [Alphaproteobacteria bacterium SO-S41]
MRYLIAAVALLALTAAAPAPTELDPGGPYARPILEGGGPEAYGEAKAPPVKAVTAGDLTVTLEVSHLSDVQARFGSEIRSEGEAGGASLWLCYVSAEAPDVFVWFVSDSEMGGPEHEVTAVALERAPGLKRGDCPVFPAGTAVSFGVPGLDATVADMVKALGPATPDAEGLAGYMFIGQIVPGYDLGQDVRYKFVDGKAVAVVVSQETTQ